MSRPSLVAGKFTFCVALIIAMAACDGSTTTATESPTVDSSAATSTAAPVGEAATSAPETTEVPVVTDGEAPVEETDEPPSDGDIGDGSCIEGDWTVTEEQLNGYYAALGAATGVPMSASGEARLRFIDLQFAYDAVFDLEMDLGGEVATARSDGVAIGSYVFEDGIISTELAANSIEVLVNVGGFEIDAGEFGNDLLSSFPINDSAYNCDGPTIFFETSAAPHPVELTPYEG